MDLLYLNVLLRQVVCYLGEVTPFSKGSSDTQGSTHVFSKPHNESCRQKQDSPGREQTTASGFPREPHLAGVWERQHDGRIG